MNKAPMISIHEYTPKRLGIPPTNSAVVTTMQKKKEAEKNAPHVLPVTVCFPQALPFSIISPFVLRNLTDKYNPSLDLYPHSVFVIVPLFASYKICDFPKYLPALHM